MRDIVMRLEALRPEITNIIGFHALMDEGAAKSPFQAMEHQTHLQAAAVKLALEVLAIIEDEQGRAVS